MQIYANIWTVYAIMSHFIFTTQKIVTYAKSCLFHTRPLPPGVRKGLRHILHIYAKYAKSEHEPI